MLHRVLSYRKLSVLAGVGITCAGLVVGGLTAWGPARAAIQAAGTCPAVSTTGVVTPAPAPGVNWSGCNIQSANLSGANLTGARLHGARLNGADLADANLTDTDLSSATLLAADLAGTQFRQTNLANATLAGSVIFGATFYGVTWLHTRCPNGANSDAYVAGCFSAVDTTPPVVAVTGVGNGKAYVTGAVPKAGCATTDDGTVHLPATVKVTTTGRNGVGRFTATCAGAVDLAGNKQKAAVGVSYTVVYGLRGFIAPANGSTIARSSRVITVRFRLTSASGSPISGSLAKALAVAHDARVTLRGPGISAVTVNCGWNAAQQDLACAIGIPSGTRAGSAQRYTITVTENAGTGFLTVPAVRGTTNPEVVHFRLGIPSWSAYAAAALRDWTPSFPRTAET